MLGRGKIKYDLNAYLMGLTQPLIGLDMTVTATVRYELIDTATRKSLVNETVTVPYTAKFSDAFIGTERLRLANEGSIRENIAAFLRHLVTVSKDFAARSGAPPNRRAAGPPRRS
ncbi:MAG: hypothetical protein OXR84_10515 [Magnetovibrio sp.]|nr:hypothetical protein [Magnetovibrio sp.]